MHREHTLDSKQGTNMADLGRKYKDDSIIVKSTFVSVFPYIFNILDISKRSCRKRSVQKTSGDERLFAMGVSRPEGGAVT